MRVSLFVACYQHSCPCVLSTVLSLWMSCLLSSVIGGTLVGSLLTVHLCGTPGSGHHCLCHCSLSTFVRPWNHRLSFRRVVINSQGCTACHTYGTHEATVQRSYGRTRGGLIMYLQVLTLNSLGRHWPLHRLELGLSSTDLLGSSGLLAAWSPWALGSSRSCAAVCLLGREPVDLGLVVT